MKCYPLLGHRRSIGDTYHYHVRSTLVPLGHRRSIGDTYHYQVKRALQQSGVKTVFKPVRTLASIFKKHKDRPSEDRITGIVYKVDCKNCEFTDVGESKRCWASRSIEHDPARAASRESLIRHHAHTTGHDIHPRYARILEHNEHNHHRRLFLEFLHSSLAKNSANERAEFPRAYVPLLKSLRDSK